MDNYTWLERLDSLAVRFSHQGVVADLEDMSMDELWGLYCYLSRLVDGDYGEE